MTTDLKTTPSVLSKGWVLKEFSDVFEGFGCMDGLYFMEVDETVRPVVHPNRKVHVTLRNRTRLKEELDDSVKEGIITPMTDPTEWVSSVVNKKLRTPLSVSNN